MEAAWKIAPLSSEHWIPSSSFISQYEKIHSRLLHTFSFQKDSLKTAIEVLEKLAETPQGRFLIQNRHLNIPHQNSLLSNQALTCSLIVWDGIVTWKPFFKPSATVLLICIPLLP